MRARPAEGAELPSGAVDTVGGANGSQVCIGGESVDVGPTAGGKRGREAEGGVCDGEVTGGGEEGWHGNVTGGSEEWHGNVTGGEGEQEEGRRNDPSDRKWTVLLR